jgi:hypothetical protein
MCLREQAVVGVGRRHRDHVGVRGRIERRRSRAGVAGSGYQHDAAVVRGGQMLLQQRVVRPGKAHVEDARAALDRPVDPVRDAHRRALTFAVERAYRQQPYPRGDPDQLTVGGNRAGHGGAVKMRLVRAEHVEARRDRAGEIRMRHIDAGVDHRHEHALAGGQAVGIGQMQLGDHVLGRIALRGWRLARRGLALLPVEVIRLRAGNARLAGERLDHRRYRAAVVDAPALDAAADQAQGMDVEAGETELPGDGVELLGGHARGNIQQDLVRDVAGFAGRRREESAAARRPGNPAASATAGGAAAARVGGGRAAGSADAGAAGGQAERRHRSDRRPADGEDRPPRRMRPVAVAARRMVAAPCGIGAALVAVAHVYRGRPAAMGARRQAADRSMRARCVAVDGPLRGAMFDRRSAVGLSQGGGSAAEVPSAR